MIPRSEARRARRVERARLTTEEEARAMAEAIRAVGENHHQLSVDTPEWRTFADGYGQALKDLAAEIQERRTFLLKRRTS